MEIFRNVFGSPNGGQWISSVTHRDRCSADQHKHSARLAGFRPLYRLRIRPKAGFTFKF